MARQEIPAVTLRGHPLRHWSIPRSCWVPGHQPQTLRPSPAFKEGPSLLSLLTPSPRSRRLEGRATEPWVSELGSGAWSLGTKVCGSILSDFQGHTLLGQVPECEQQDEKGDPECETTGRRCV